LLFGRGSHTEALTFFTAHLTCTFASQAADSLTEVAYMYLGYLNLVLVRSLHADLKS